MQIEIGKLIRSRRRSISAEIDHDAQLIIRAPNWVSEKFIAEFIEQRKSWIIKHRQMALAKKPPMRRYVDGEAFLYMGRSYPLRISEFRQSRLSLKDGEFCLSHLYANQARKEFLDWYRSEAKRVIEDRLIYFSNLTGIPYASMSINQARRQWGSCTGKNRISFTWRLIMAPQSVIDAVVVHELMHVKEKNHSPKFWQEVKKIYPNYDEAGKWLESNSHLLTL